MCLNIEKDMLKLPLLKIALLIFFVFLPLYGFAQESDSSQNILLKSGILKITKEVQIGYGTQNLLFTDLNLIFDSGFLKGLMMEVSLGYNFFSRV